MKGAPGYTSLEELKADLDRALEGFSEEQMERACAKAFMAGRSDRLYMRIGDRLGEVARTKGVDSDEWNKLAAHSEVRAAFLALRAARMANSLEL
jgi:hypothetical protein